jgi:hypothetical protein
VKAFHFVAVTLLVGGFTSCSHPAEPPPPVTVSDSVTVSGPKAGIEKVPVTFTAHSNFKHDTGIRWIHK